MEIIKLFIYMNQDIIADAYLKIKQKKNILKN